MARGEHLLSAEPPQRGSDTPGVDIALSIVCVFLLISPLIAPLGTFFDVASVALGAIGLAGLLYARLRATDASGSR